MLELEPEIQDTVPRNAAFGIGTRYHSICS